MLTLLRRCFWLGLFGGAGYGAWTLWQRQQTPAPVAAPEWPPITVTPPPAARAGGGAPDATVDRSTSVADVAAVPADAAATVDGGGAADRRWVEPVDGACPDGYPIKANDKSGIYHVPGGRFYDRTIPQRCYASADDAEADGYRAAKA